MDQSEDQTRNDGSSNHGEEDLADRGGGPDRPLGSGAQGSRRRSGRLLGSVSRSSGAQVSRPVSSGRRPGRPLSSVRRVEQQEVSSAVTDPPAPLRTRSGRIVVLPSRLRAIPEPATQPRTGPPRLSGLDIFVRKYNKILPDLGSEYVRFYPYWQGLLTTDRNKCMRGVLRKLGVARRHQDMGCRYFRSLHVLYLHVLYLNRYYYQ